MFEKKKYSSSYLGYSIIKRSKYIVEKFSSPMLRIRTKQCFKCYTYKDILYCCRYDKIKCWLFLCGNCLMKIKFELNYT